MSTSQSKRFRWVNNKVFSVKLRNGHYALFQTLGENGYIACFNHFSEENSWADIELKHEDILFTKCTLRSFFVKSELFKQYQIEPLLDIEVCDKELAGTDVGEFTCFAGTDHEVVVGGLIGGDICLYWDIDAEEEPTGVIHNSVKIDINSETEYQKYKAFEDSALPGYPHLNERLLLCEHYQENFSIEREILFRRELDLICLTYLQIYDGKTSLSELGYSED